MRNTAMTEKEFRERMCEVVRLRYNTYPKLRRAAEKVLVAARTAKNLFGDCNARTALVLAIQELEVELR